MRRHHPRRAARMAALTQTLYLVGAVRRDDLPVLAEALGCSYRALLCDLLALKKEGVVRVTDDAVDLDPAARAPAAAA